MNDNDNGEGFHPGRVAGGFIILALGATMLLDRNGMLGGHSMRYFGGVALIAIGAARLLGVWRCNRRGRGEGTVSAVWLVFLGAWLIASQANLLGLTFQTSWPLLIIGVGIVIVARELLPDRGRNRQVPDAPAPRKN
jgi:hypothetical protein